MYTSNIYLTINLHTINLFYFFKMICKIQKREREEKLKIKKKSCFFLFSCFKCSICFISIVDES